MDREFWATVGAVFCLIVISSFLSGTKAGMTAASRARLNSLAASGNRRARLAGRLILHKDRLIGALLIGNNLVKVLACALATALLLDIFGDIGILYTTIAMTVLIVIFAEILPQSWALARPEAYSLFVAPFARLIVFLFGALSSSTNWLVRKVLSLVGFDVAHGTPLLSAQDELRETVASLHRDGGVIKQDRDRMGGLLDLAELEVSDVMVHRTAMRMVNGDEPAEAIVRAVLASPHTRLPMWKGSTENIVGVIHSKDLLRALDDVSFDFSRIDIMKVASKPWFVPDTTSLQDQLNAFLRRKAHFAIVVDEYGEVEGLVTLEDIIEEIIGDIADEHDVDVQGVKQEADGSVVVDGSVPIRDLNRALDWSLPDEEATTIAGLVIHESQTIPERRQAFTFHGKRFIIMKRERNRITRIRIRPADAV
jgi:Mg2+/Co2+ transporter CorB